MTSTEDIRKEIVNNERRLRQLLSQDNSADFPKIAEIRSNLVSLKFDLIQLEKNVGLIKKENANNSEIATRVDALTNRINTITHDVLSSRYSEKYSPACYFERPILAEYFNEFLTSSKTVMVLTGKAGFGKSVFVCNLADVPPDNLHVLLQDSTQLKIENESIDTYLGKMLNYDGGVLEYLGGILSVKNNRSFLIVFDSINEHTKREALVSKLAEFVNKIEDPRIKVLLTCRIPLWNTIKRFFNVPIDRVYHVAGPDSYVEVDSFTKEETELVYNNYKDAYNLRTNYTELSEQVKYFIANPLFLKMAAEVYGGNQQEIPKALALRDVFSEYILGCLGEQGYESTEFGILQRIIEIMYEKAKKELELGILKQDSKIGQYIIPNCDTPFLNLVDDGLLSQKDEKSIIRTVQKIYVTYERVFEYLLAEFVIGEVTLEKILENLDLARTKSFIQLRGALELALSFSILHNQIDASILIELAKVNRPDSRQYLIDVIQTICDSGYYKLAESIVVRISEDKSLEAKILAAQAAYQVGLEKRLVLLSLSNDEQLSQISTLFLYERWNRYRKTRDMEKAYQIFEELRSMINIIHPQKSVKVFHVLASMTGYMFVHVIDDRKSVYPLLDFYKDLLYKVPGSRLLSSQGQLGLLSRATDVVVEALAISWARIISLEQDISDILQDSPSIRALFDIGELTAQESLLNYKNELITLLTWKKFLVSYFAGSLITHQTYFNFDQHLAFFGDILLSDQLEIVHKMTVLRAFTVGLIARVLHEKDIPDGVENDVFDHLISMWGDVQNEEIDFGAEKKSVSSSSYLSSPIYIWKATLFSLLYLEALLQRKSGNIAGSNFIKKFMNYSAFTDSYAVNVMIESLEKIAYQGFVEFAVLSITSKDFRVYWEEDSTESVVKSLSNCRGLYQKEVDGILKDQEDLRSVWEAVRSNNNFPREAYFRDVSNYLWGQVFIAIDMNVEKAAGVLFLELADSKTVKECMRRMMKATLDILAEPVRLNILHYQWALIHDKEMKRFEKFEFPDDIQTTRPELHARYKEVIERIVNKYGLGMLHKVI